LLQADNTLWQVSKDLTKPFEIKQALESLDLLVSKFIPVRNALKLAQQARKDSWPENERSFAIHLQKQIEQKLNVAANEAGNFAATDIKVSTPAIDEWQQEASGS
jgi:sugar phosphate isomerase/epimerase